MFCVYSKKYVDSLLEYTQIFFRVSYGVVTVAGFVEKRAIFLVFAGKTENNIIFHYKMLENWNFWVF